MREDGLKVLRILSAELRANVEELATTEVLEDRFVEELTEFFYDDTGFDPDATTVTQDIDPNGRIILVPKEIATKVKKPIELPELDNDEREIEDEDETDSQDTTKDELEEDTEETEKNESKKARKIFSDVSIPLTHQRIIRSKEDFTLILRSKKSFNGLISIFELGVDIQQPLKVSNSSKGVVQADGRISVQEKDFEDGKLKLTFGTKKSAIGGLTVYAVRKYEISAI